MKHQAFMVTCVAICLEQSFIYFYPCSAVVFTLCVQPCVQCVYNVCTLLFHH